MFSSSILIKLIQWKGSSFNVLHKNLLTFSFPVSVLIQINPKWVGEERKWRAGEEHLKRGEREGPRPPRTAEAKAPKEKGEDLTEGVQPETDGGGSETEIERDGRVAAEKEMQRETIVESKGRGVETGSEEGVRETEKERDSVPVRGIRLKAQGLIERDGWSNWRRTGQNRRRWWKLWRHQRRRGPGDWQRKKQRRRKGEKRWAGVKNTWVTPTQTTPSVITTYWVLSNGRRWVPGQDLIDTFLLSLLLDIDSYQWFLFVCSQALDIKGIGHLGEKELKERNKLIQEENRRELQKVRSKEKSDVMTVWV